ncbi:MAG: SusF/SusE family outer membrane protein [Muribaculaceae bacterium]|nr:SusF/SusE family outer membrane protein [Muribaculaceae bacterium]
MNKKLLKSFFAVVLAVAGIFAFSHYSNATVGDVDGDGVVTANDVTAVYNYLLNGDTEFYASSDVDGDGTVTAADVMYIYNILLGNTPAEPDHVYILGNATEWNPAVGQEMTTEDGVTYTAVFEAQDINDGYSWFGFTTKLAAADSEDPWGEIADYRFGALTNGDDFLVTEETIGITIPLTKEDYHAFQIPAGKYEFSLNLNEMALVITKVEEPQPENKVYILGEVNGNSWAANQGLEMATEDGKIFTAQITTKESGFSYFGFTTLLAETSDEWDYIAPFRFGPVSVGDLNFIVTEETLGTEISLTTEDYQAIQMAPGSFNLSLDLENMKLIITGEFTPQQPAGEGWYLIGTNNNWSTSDMSYPFVQDAQNENVYSIHVDNVSGDFWFKIAAEGNYTLADFWSGNFLSAATDGESALSGTHVQGNQGAFCIPGSYNCTYLDITIDVENLTYTITTDGQEPIVDPNAEYDYVYIAGTADGWSGNGGKLASVKDANDYYGFFNATGEFKIQKNQGSWATNWGGSNGNLVAGGANIQANGFVYVNANIGELTYSVTDITSMGIIGDATPGGWEAETALTYNAETNAWEADVTLTTGNIKFRANGGWEINFGGALNNLVMNGDNIVVEAGTYKVALTLVCPGEYTATLTPAN